MKKSILFLKELGLMLRTECKAFRSETRINKCPPIVKTTILQIVGNPPYVNSAQIINDKPLFLVRSE